MEGERDEAGRWRRVKRWVGGCGGKRVWVEWRDDCKMVRWRRGEARGGACHLRDRNARMDVWRDEWIEVEKDGHLHGFMDG